MNKSITFFLLLFSFQSFSQILFSNGATIQNNGAVFFCNGGITLSNGTSLINQGVLQTTKNSTLPDAGTFTLSNVSDNVAGNGTYSVEQDWVNNGTFLAQASTVFLNGNTQQFITSTNGTITEFNNLNLIGLGVGVNRRKTLQNVDMRISTTGILDIQNRILNTATRTVTVLNTAVGSVINTIFVGSEGYVASQGVGTFVRNTNAVSTYLFPTGSFIGNERYRPANLTPNTTANTAYSVRLDNTDATLDGFNRSQSDNKSCTSNPLFYHSINRVLGATNADISVSYNIASDNDWSGVSQWRTASSNWNDISTTNALLTGTLTFRTRLAWAFVNPGDPYILTNIRPESPVIDCNAICENSEANSYSLTGNTSSYQWETSTNGSVASGQGTNSITVDWLTGSGLITAVSVGANGCNSIPDSCTVIAVPQPIADFNFLMEGADVNFINSSSNDVSWDWNLGDGTNATNENPSHSYQDGGEFTVILLVENSLGCSDTISKSFSIDQTIEIPNVITPNEDQINDTFLIKTGALKTYDLVILNRWGNVVFESNDKNIHWTGKVNGESVSEGVYFYKLKVETSSKKYDFHGNVTVINN